MRGWPLDRLVERARKGNDRAPASGGLAAALVAALEPAARWRCPVEIERVGPVGLRIGDADGSQDLARGGDHAAFPQGVVVA
jgi:hypothetical protein